MSSDTLSMFIGSGTVSFLGVRGRLVGFSGTELIETETADVDGGSFRLQGNQQLVRVLGGGYTRLRKKKFL